VSNHPRDEPSLVELLSNLLDAGPVTIARRKIENLDATAVRVECGGHSIDYATDDGLARFERGYNARALDLGSAIRDLAHTVADDVPFEAQRGDFR